MTERHLRVAGSQMLVGTDVQANVDRIIDALDWAAGEAAEILLTPEGALSGYTHAIDQAVVTEGLAQVTEHARGLSVGLALGTCFIEPSNQCYNQLRFYRPDGHYLGFHSKILRCATVDGTATGEIQQFATTGLNCFDWRPHLRIGGLVCNDLWANPSCTPMPDPHLTQQLAVMNVDVIFHAVNGARDGSGWSRVAWAYHESNLMMRAQAGGIWIVTVDNAHPVDKPCSTPSGVINPTGAFACRTESCGEQRFVHTIELKKATADA